MGGIHLGPWILSLPVLIVPLAILAILAGLVRRHFIAVSLGFLMLLVSVVPVLEVEASKSCECAWIGGAFPVAPLYGWHLALAGALLVVVGSLLGWMQARNGPDTLSSEGVAADPAGQWTPPSFRLSFGRRTVSLLVSPPPVALFRGRESLTR